jgi:hypothetical protein
VSSALAVSAAALLAVALIGVLMPCSPLDEDIEDQRAELGDLDVEMKLVGRSGPIVLTMEYEIPLDDARRFYEAMTLVRSVRLRNGAYAWSLSRDVAEPEKWIERFQTPTWHDYLRHRERLTEAERKQILAVNGEPVKVRRMLERPVGSVRWRDETPDSGLVFPPARD